MKSKGPLPAKIVAQGARDVIRAEVLQLLVQYRQLGRGTDDDMAGAGFR